MLAKFYGNIPVETYTAEELLGFSQRSKEAIRNSPIPCPRNFESLHPFFESDVSAPVVLEAPTMADVEEALLNIEEEMRDGSSQGNSKEMLVDAARLRWLESLEACIERLSHHWERHRAWLEAFDEFYKASFRRLYKEGEAGRPLAIAKDALSTTVIEWLLDTVQSYVAASMGWEHGWDDELVGQRDLTFSLRERFRRDELPQSLFRPTAHVDPLLFSLILQTKADPWRVIFRRFRGTNSEATRKYFTYILDACLELSCNSGTAILGSPRRAAPPSSAGVLMAAGLSVAFLTFISLMYFPSLLG
ncbi:hypothetical protein BOTBODRAFT_40261 [Botryobasidium botryosum FD-172 SS1]|uniref:Uncharacterized protein n=1 Tax=Botryobasidium botryosum (strain FD-172 SS1) TaxID=930990 RepID=A0A067N0G4_BOTB1|nr:hypothetical protein BOTBODRAFT_40261 [Botryobasidium botryosum FD-172 SS1]